MKNTIILISFLFQFVHLTSIDWCEYWARMGKKTERPECAGYELPNNVKRTENVVQCPKNEMYNCIDCEPTCHNLIPKCRKEQCSRGCICKTGFARNSQGKCVQYRDCLHHHPPTIHNESIKEEDDGAVMKTVKKMVPVIVNDVWKAFFNSIRVPEEQNSKQLELKPVPTNETEDTFSGTEIEKEHKRIFQKN
ncbi:unnamed protein product [Caenorhabditis angaria]|uniref:TIL domain-containing protein n=1 Tax=Caenorhabditis angaria TaxID=860376 RepID=A0A9P1N7Q4_9PELO|nr:unnamed protein product [Caenorhabditis angaria]